tara:strand:+ start:242 stop:607 length:366 start_codon:yes stop_codon:yes gene_type:complete
MANFVGTATVDTVSTDANCLYPAAPLGGTPTISSNVIVNGQPLQYYSSTSIPDPVTGVKINPLIPLPCQPGTRVVTPTVNTTVFINGKLPAVTGDQAAMLGTPRPLTGPFQHVKILIGTQL